MRILLSILLFSGLTCRAAAWADVGFQECQFGTIGAGRTECASLTVPESRSGTNGIRLKLPFVIFRAAEASTLPPVLILTGGPGGLIDIHRRDGLRSWVKYAEGFQQGGPRDVILFSQRGTDNEQGKLLACSTLQDPEISLGAVRRGGQEIDWRTAFKASLAQCRDKAIAAGHDLAAYSTAESVRDIAALKAGLGITEWILYGVSYGAGLALEIARHDSQGITALILDSPASPGSVSGIQDAALLARSLHSLGEICAGLWRCRALSQNVYEDTLSRLNRLREKPLKLRLRSPETGTRYDIEMNDALFSQLLLLSFYHPDAIAQIPAILAELRRGRHRTLRHLANQLFMTKRAIHIGTFASVRCQDQNPQRLLTSLKGELQRAQPGFHAMITDQIWLTKNLCQIWLQDKLPTIFPDAVQSETRTLILAGDLDPITPGTAANNLAGTLQNATVKIYPDTSHGVLEFLPCAWQDVGAFLQGNQPVTTAACRRHYSF